MHISDMLNPEVHSEKAYCTQSQLQTRIHNTGTTNIPRSTISPVAQLSSLPPAHSYTYGYSPYGSSGQSYVGPSIDNNHSRGVDAPNTYYQSHRKSTTDSPTSDYSAPHNSPARLSLSMTTLHDGQPHAGTVHSMPQGLYTYAQPCGTDPLAALATLAASRDSRERNGQDNRFWGTNDFQKWGNSSSWSPQPLGGGCLEVISRRNSQSLSPCDNNSEYDTLPSPIANCRRTVSVGSQTSRPNSPEASKRATRAQPPGICTSSVFIGGSASSNRSSSSSLVSPISPSSEIIPDSPSSDIVKADADHKCSYTDSCETGSPLRKVVSHFFGRNKLATRKIPKHLWVYFCRKHYQRSRYRNPRGFACLQIQLVQTQIGNLRRWGGVIDWTVKVRRREEMRSKTNVVGTTIANHAEGEEPTGELRAVKAVARRRTSGGGTIPPHYLQYVGEHKSMEEVTALVEAIQQDMEQNGGTFPDLELLPRVGGDGSTSEGTEERNDRGKWKRARFAKPRQTQMNKRKSTSIGDSSVIPTSAAEYTSIALSQRQLTHNVATVTTRNGMAAVQPISGENSLPMRPKRQIEIRCEETEATSSINQPVETPGTPTKRRRLSHEESPMQDHNQQTVTPPASAPSVSRRTSLAIECVTPAPSLSRTVLEEVDAVLESVRVTSGANPPCGQ